MAKHTDKAGLFMYYWRICVEQSAYGDPVAEYSFATALKRKWRFDFAWPEQKLAVEIDGGQWAANGGRHARDTDRDKLNAAAALGWRVMRFSPEMLTKDPEGCLAQVLDALGHQ